MGRFITTTLTAGSAPTFRSDRRLYFANGSYTFIVPDGVTKIFGIVIGAGGGGGGGVGGTTYWTCGGGGGGYAQGEVAVTPGQSIAITVGAGGAGGTSSGGAGTSSSLGTFLTATGGGGSPFIYYGAATSTGGTGSTSGVSAAFTSSGGYTTVLYNANYIGCGGAASGSPYGDSGFISHSAWNPYATSGGGGWTPSNVNVTSNSVLGGASQLGWPTDSQAKSGIFVQASNSANGSTIGLLTGNATWWFPWEADGASGAGSSSGYKGGHGCGGGPAWSNNSVTGTGGDGGFGGGGGGAGSHNTSISSTARGGKGGTGGGGGHTNFNNGSTTGGSGGNGCVLIYW